MGVKSWNVSEIPDYARLIARGLPTFIEVKGVTFCGKSDGSNLTMENVPFHFEVIRFCEKLCEYLSDDYEIACEHAHSCCVLIAKKEMKIDVIGIRILIMISFLNWWRVERSLGIE